MTCNCGVVVRDHNDVIEFNCCNDVMVRDQTTPIIVKIRSKKCLAPGISIKKATGTKDTQYEVGMSLQKHKLFGKEIQDQYATKRLSSIPFPRANDLWLCGMWPIFLYFFLQGSSC